MNVGNSSNFSTSSFDSTWTYSFTVQSGDDYLVVTVSCANSRTFNSVKIDPGGADEATFTQSVRHVDSSGGLVAAVFVLRGSSVPGAGTYDIEIALSGGSRGYSSCLALQGAKDQAPEATASDDNASGTSTSTNITTLTDGAFIVDSIFVNVDQTGTLPTADAGQTEIGSANPSGFGDYAAGSSYEEKSSAGSEGLGWSWDTDASWSHALVAIAPGTTPVSASSSSLHEALEGIRQTSEGLHEARGLLAVQSSSVHEAKGVLRATSTGLFEALDGTVAATSSGLHEALGRVAAASLGLHEAKGRLVASSVGLQEAVEPPSLGLGSFLFYWAAENAHRPIVGGDPIATRDGVRYYLDPNTEKYRRVPAHYFPTEVRTSYTGFEIPVLHLERAGIAENADTNRFDSGSGWGVGTFASVSPVASAFEGEHGYLFRASATSAAVRQVVGTFTGSPETFSAVIEVVRRPGGGEVSLQLYDTDGSSVVARADLDVDTGSVTAVTGEAELVRAWSRKGPNGGDVYRFTCRGTGTNGNARRIEVFPTGPGTGSDSGTVVVHHAQLEEQAWASSPIVSETAGATRATTDLYFAGGAPRIDSKAVIYGRLWKDFDGDGPGAFPVLFTVGAPAGVRLLLYWAGSVGFKLVNSSTDVTTTLSPVGDAGDEIEFYWILEPDWSGRVGLRVEGGSAAGADHFPIAPEDWGENRIYMNRRSSTKKGAGSFDALKVFLAADLSSALDGSEDDDLFDELRESRLTRRGVLYTLT